MPELRDVIAMSRQELVDDRLMKVIQARRDRTQEYVVWIIRREPRDQFPLEMQNGQRALHASLPAKMLNV